jgi:hypothetical protein
MRRAVTCEPEPDIEVRGEFAADIMGYARRRIGEIPELEYRTTSAVRVKLARQSGNGSIGPVTAQASLTANSRLVRAQVVAHAPGEAVDLLATRLEHRLSRVSRLGPAPARIGLPIQFTERARPGRGALAHGVLTKIRRRKPIQPASLTVDEAALEMHLRDYAFHFFTEFGTGQDSVLYRIGTAGYRLVQLHPVPRRDLARFSLPLTIDGEAPPIVGMRQAVADFDESDLRFQLFLDRETQRGNVLYRRYDGMYGLILPAAQALDPITVAGARRLQVVR